MVRDLMWEGAILRCMRQVDDGEKAMNLTRRSFFFTPLAALAGNAGIKPKANGLPWTREHIAKVFGVPVSLIGNGSYSYAADIELQYVDDLLESLRRNGIIERTKQ